VWRGPGRDREGTYSVHVQDVDVRRSHEQVLQERRKQMPWLELPRRHINHHHRRLYRRLKSEERTKINEDKMYNPKVANSDNTILRKIGFVNTSAIFSAWPVFWRTEAATFSMPLIARRNAATVIYTVINANPTMAMVYPTFEPCGLLPRERMKHMMRMPR
jgi:hypothetical protein